MLQNDGNSRPGKSWRRCWGRGCGGVGWEGGGGGAGEEEEEEEEEVQGGDDLTAIIIFCFIDHLTYLL